MSIDFRHGDCRDVLLDMALSGETVDSVVTDPPYGLVSITKRFGKSGAAAAKFGADGAFNRSSSRFVGKEWDNTGIERDPTFWSLVLDVLKPGGFCLAFSSPRTGHRQAVAMEDAGFTMHPMHGWAYGSGLPKHHPMDKALLREGLPEIAEEWVGWGYGAQAVSPALEPVYVGQKPFSESNGAKNLLKHGVGAMNLHGCRNERGNHPANLMLEGCPEVLGMFPTNSGGSTSRFFPIFYHAKANAEDRAGIEHPTVKPIGLIRQLCRLVTPPGGTVLDMFAGTGTTGIAAEAEGFNSVLIEADDDYARAIKERLNPCDLFE